MQNRMDNATESYKRHAAEEEINAKSACLPERLTHSDTVDAWRHRRMHEFVRPILAEDPQSKWLTVGDGNFGSDAHYLQEQGADVVASSLTDGPLKVAKEKGFIQKFSRVNAEQIPYDDDSFDFVLCKEAYHHFPRPAIAFYEMLRVAKQGVVLIEPYDGPPRLFDLIKEPMKKLLWGKAQTIHFEPSGNFIYRIHPNQMAKKLAAMGCAAVAYKTFNDIYLPKYGASKAGATIGHRATRLAILLQDILCALRLLNPGLVTLIAFKHEPSVAFVSRYKKAGFTIWKLPQNPYI